MKSEYRSILHRLSTAGNEIDERIFDVLADDKTELEARESDSGSTVHKTLGIWRRRLKASHTSGYPLLGAENLVHQLEVIKPQHSKISQVNIRNAVYACVLFFEWTSGRFIGSVISEKPESSENEKTLDIVPGSAGERVHPGGITHKNGRHIRQA